MTDLKALVDEITAPVKYGSTCWRNTLDGDALKLVEMVENKTSEPNGSKLSGALWKLGIPLTPQTVRRHYRGDCSCRKN